MLDKFKTHLVGDAHQWHKLWSSWVAAAWGLIVTVFWTSPDSFAHAVAGLPDDVRNLLSPIVMGVVTGLPIIVRLLKQNRLVAPSDPPVGE